MSNRSLLAALLAATILAGCDEPLLFKSEPRPVRTTIVEQHAEGEIVSLTGQIRAKDQANLAFRLDGRMIERLVNRGDAVQAGQVVARLAPETHQHALRSAQASLAAAEALLTQARLTFGRQQQLLKDGWTTRARFDDAEQTVFNLQAQVDAARAQMRIAQEQLSYTVLTADAAGWVTEVGAEPGEVVRAGQAIVQVAREGGRDAVFDFPESLIRTGPRDPLVEIALTDDAQVTATGRVREVAPQADAATRTFQVKVALFDPPEGMRLGSTVIGRIRLAAPAGLTLPASALTEADGRPAVWVVEPQSRTVVLRSVEIARHDPATVVISRGLESGELVVTAGVQMLRPGQQVRILGAG